MLLKPKLIVSVKDLAVAQRRVKIKIKKKIIFLCKTIQGVHKMCFSI